MLRRMVLGLPALLSACSPTGMLNALTPSAGLMIETGLPYGNGGRRLLDVYAPAGVPSPAGVPPKAASVVVFLYGGAWRTGDRGMYRFLGSTLARRGTVVVVPDYRLYPQVRFPDFLHDTARALAWTHHHAARLGGDPGRIVVMGHSAGAYLALMLALDRRWLREAGLNPDRDLAGAIGLSGPYDFLPPDDPALAPIFPDDPAVSQPIAFARGDAPPVLLVHGQSDAVVRPVQTTRLATALRAAGGRVAVRMYDGVGHAALLGAITAPLSWLAPVLTDVEAFVAAVPSRAGL